MHLMSLKKTGYCIFFDFSKAFDKINRTIMLHKLLGKINPFIWRALHAYYSVSVVYIADPNDP